MSARRSICVLAVLSLFAGAAATAGAGEKPDDFNQRLFAGRAIAPKAYACFVRSYDAAHLARHPQQKVRVMKLLVTAETSAEDQSLSYTFRLGVGFRNRSGAFDSVGGCGHAKSGEDEAGPAHLGCSIECDGGGMGVDLADDNKSVLVGLSRIRIWPHGKLDDKEAARDLESGADDRVFRLERVIAAECAPLVTDRKELAALRRN